LHKVTIIPRGRALGVTMSLPERDKLSYSKEWCEGKIAMAFGGRVAEQLIYGKDHLNTGASSDITQATNIARKMVTEWGMSDKLGPLLYSGEPAGGVPRPLSFPAAKHERGNGSAD
jgi:cell division protease FtsH